MIVSLALQSITIVSYSPSFLASWNRNPDRYTLCLGIFFIQAIFLYLVVVLPWFQGYLPNVSLRRCRWLVLGRKDEGD
jgi:hypothetical protein